MSYEMPIDRSKVREFARAVYARNPGHRGSDAVIPPTMLTSARMFWEPSAESAFPALGFDLRRVLHGEEEYVFHGPLPRVGDTVVVETRVERTYEKPGKRGGTMRFGVIVNEFRDASGALVAEQRSTIIETEKPPTPERDGA
jgi:N-terminal half of MaoC dehydratase